MDLVWLIILAAVLYWGWRRWRVLQRGRGDHTGSEDTDAILVDLAVLRLELERQKDAGRLPQTQYLDLSARLNQRLLSALEAKGAVPGEQNWHQLQLRGWQRLEPANQPPPWWEPAAQPPTAEHAPESTPTTAPFTVFHGQGQTNRTPGKALPAVDPADTGAGSKTAPERTPAAAFDPAGSLPAPSPAGPQAAKTPPVTESALTEQGRFAFRARQPGALERTLQAVSGWPRLLAPFLVQNIGFFIGGLLFVTGSIFLVSYTAGFVRGVTVLAILVSYTSLLVAGGYLLRRRRPDLPTASGVLMTLGLLLVPLDIAAAVRLIVGAQSPPQVLAAWSLAVLVPLLFGMAARLVAGVMQRALQGGFSLLFLALGTAQLAVPLLARWPRWWLLAGLHLLLLGLLGSGLVRFAKDWLQQVFIEREQTALFAAGSLVYAALVSFVHLRWSGPVSLPAGYYGPFLMAVTGLLFYLDAQLKTYADRRPYLSRFVFLLYGLTVLALVLTRDAPAARTLTLALAAVIYAMVVWRYLSPTPFYLLLGSLLWLYATTVLGGVGQSRHWLVSLPGLGLLWLAIGWMRHAGSRRQGMPKLARDLYLLLLALLPGLTLWSLWSMGPGLWALALVLSTCILLEPVLASGMRPLLDRTGPPASADLRDSGWVYAQTGMLGLAVLAMPSASSPDGFSALTPSPPIVLGFLAVAMPFLWLGMGAARAAHRKGRAQALLNSALAVIALALGIALPWLADTAFNGSAKAAPGAVLAVAWAAGLLFWLGLGLHIRWPVYTALALAALAGIGLKLALFPEPGRGGTVLLLAIGLWGLSWWLQRSRSRLPAEIASLRRQRAKLDISGRLVLLGVLPVARFRPLPRPRPDPAAGD